MNRFFAAAGIVTILAGCVYYVPEEIRLAPQDLPERFKSVFRRDFPSEEITAVRQHVFQDKVVGYVVYFVDGSRSKKKIFIRSDGEVSKVVPAGEGEP